MKEIQTVTQSFLKNHEKQKKYLAIITVLSLLVSFAVPFSLIMPAVSMSGSLTCGMEEHTHTNECYGLVCGLEETEEHIHTDECYGLICELEEHIHSEECYEEETSAFANVLPDAVNLSNVGAASKPATGDGGYFEKVIESDQIDDYWRNFKDDISKANITLTGTFTNSDGSSVTNPTISVPNSSTEVTYKILGEGVESVPATFEITYSFNNQTGDGNKISADNYCLYYQLPDGVTLTNQYGGSCQVTDDSNQLVGYYSISEGGLVVIQLLESYVKTVSTSGNITGHLTFTGNIGRADTADGTRSIEIGGTKINIDFPDVDDISFSKSGNIVNATSATGQPTIKWTVTANDVFDTDTVTLGGASISDNNFPFGGTGVTIKLNGNVVDASSIGSWNGTTFTFNDSVSDGAKVVFEYETAEITDINSDLKNNSSKTYENIANLSFKSENTTKEKEANGKVTVSGSDFGFTKSGVQDYANGENQNNKIDWTVSIKHPYGASLNGYIIEDDAFNDSRDITVKDKDGNDLKYDLSKNSIVINADVSEVYITYSTTDAECGQSYSNEAALKYPGNGTEIKTSTAVVTYENQHKISKYGKYDPDTDKITWTVDASVTDKSVINLDGYEIKDPMLVDLSWKDITVVYKNGWTDALKDTSINDNVLSLKQGDGVVATLTKNGDTISVSGTITDLTLTYTTKVDRDNLTTNNTVTNSVTDNRGNSASKGVGVSRDSSISKNISGSSSKSIYFSDSMNKTQTLSWNINLDKYDGFAGKTVTDTLSQSDRVTHTLNADSIVVKGTVNSGDTAITLVKDTDYTLNAADTEFTIVFKNTVDTLDIKHITVSYNTTADYSSISSPEGSPDTYTFSNTSSFDSKTSSAEYKLQVKNPNIVTEIKLTVGKKWCNAQGTAIDSPTASIKVRIKRTLNGTTEYLKSDGITWIDSDNDDTIITISSSENWSKSFTVPKDTTSHNGDYVYSVEEIEVLDGYTVSYSSDSVTGGDGTITITNKQKPAFDKTAIDKDGNAVTKIQLSDLETVTYGSEEYYAVKWEIDVGAHDGYAITLEDTIEDSMVFLKDLDKGEQDSFNHKLTYPAYYQSEYYYMGFSGLNAGTYSVSGSTVTFKMNSNSNNYKIFYYVGIPVSSVKGDENLTLHNSVTVKNSSTGEELATPEANLEIIAESDEDTGLLKKIATNRGGYYAVDGFIEYVVYANVNGKTLSNDSYYDITDNLLVNSWGDGADNVNVSLYDITVEEIEDVEVASDGTVTDYTVVNSNVDFSYQKTEKTTVPGTSSLTFGNIGTDGWVTSSVCNLEKGTEVIFNLEFSGENPEVYLYIDGYYDVNKQGQINLTVEDGKATVTVALDRDAESVMLCDKTKQMTSVSATAIVPTLVSSGGFVLTVPDETPLKITYRYQLTDADGNLLVKEITDGFKPLVASNTVSIDTGNAQGTDSNDNIEFQVSKSAASLTADSLPKIYKTDVNNLTVKLSADFVIAKYVDGKWQFVTGEKTEQINSDDGTTSEQTAFVFGESVDGNTIPTNAKKFTIQESGYQFRANDITDDVLYKLVEINPPSGYEGYFTYPLLVNDVKYDNFKEMLSAYLSDNNVFEGSIYDSFFKNYQSTFYFVKKSDDGSVTYPTDITASDVTEMKSADLNITNNKIISVTANKTWNTKNSTDNASVEVKLYWSYSKKSNGFPSDLREVTELGVAYSDYYTRTLDSTNDWTCTWNYLPSGNNGKSIYYYVVETSYTVNSTTYSLSKDVNDNWIINGVYKDTEGNEGDFKPNYTGNATNKTGDVNIENADGLQIKKVWKNSDNTDMTVIPVNSVEFKFYGVTSENDKVLLGTYTLSNENNWAYYFTITELEKFDKAATSGEYVSYKVVEVVDNVVELYGYSVSSLTNLNGKTGTITLVNKDNTPTKANVTVNKVWGDGNDNHGSDTVNVKFYTSMESLTNDELIALANGDTSKIIANPTDKNGNAITDTVTLNASNNWSYTWSNLPYSNENKQVYHYYAVETDKFEGYEVKYDSSGRSERIVTITNYKPAKLTVSKEWYDTDGTTRITEDYPSNEIVLELYQKQQYQQDDNVDLSPNNLNVVAIGDSITLGSYNNVSESKRYPETLQSLLQSKGYDNATVSNKGQNSNQVSDVERRMEATYSGDQKIDNLGTADVVTLLIGTNDVHQNGSKQDVNTIAENIKRLIIEIQGARTDGTTIKVFVGTVPYFDFTNDNGVTTDGGNWWNGSGYTQETANAKIDSLNALIKDLASEEDSIYVVDVNSVVDKDTMLADGCHPNEAGYAAIATAYFNAINKVYTGDDGTGGTDIEGVPSDVDTYEKIDTITLNAENNWSATIENLTPTDEKGNDYIYYVKETTTGEWETVYDTNGKTLSDGDKTITVKNTKVNLPKGTLSIRKLWENDDSDTSKRPNQITVNLYRTTTPLEGDESGSEDNSSTSNSVTVTSSGSSIKIPISESFVVGDSIKIKFSPNADEIGGFDVNNSSDQKIIYCNMPTITNNETTITSDETWWNNNNTPASLVIYTSTWGNFSTTVTATVTYISSGSTTTSDTTTDNTGDDSTVTTAVVQYEEGKYEVTSNLKIDESVSIADLLENTGISTSDITSITFEWSGYINSIGLYSDTNTSGDWHYNLSNAVTTTIDSSGKNYTSFTVNNSWQGSLNKVIFSYKKAITTTTTTTTTVATTTTAPPKVTPEVPDISVYKVLTLTADDDWGTTETLPTQDKDGNTYYYYILEGNVGGGYIPISYKLDGVSGINVTTLKESSTSSFEITNYKTNVEGYELPSTGGTGNGGYKEMGIAIMIISTASYIVIRRKVKNRR